MILNTSQMIADIRGSLNEATANFWSDLEILRKLNKAQSKIYTMISQQVGDWFLTKTTLTPSSGLLILPSNCAKIVYAEDSTHGTEIPLSAITVRERRLTRIIGTNLDILEPDAYPYGNYLEINQDNYSGSVVLWYDRRIADLHTGTGGSGSTSNTLVFQATNIPVARDDYYNGVYVSITAGTGVGTRVAISDYVGSTYTATATGTFGTDSIYGTETELPEEAIPFLLDQAIVDLVSKPSAAIDPKYYEFAKLNLKDSRTDFNDWCSTRIKNTTRIRPQEDWL